MHDFKLIVMYGLLGQAAMAGHDSGSQHQFTGFQKYFNSYTIIGRRNVPRMFEPPICVNKMSSQASNHSIYLLFTARHSIKDINVKMLLNNVPDLIVLLFLKMPLQELHGTHIRLILHNHRASDCKSTSQQQQLLSLEEPANKQWPQPPGQL
ncbi:hypothetical protein IHE44_0001507 [Lamprotornis superbus]|uniref:Uncharacterized protein n=1 Tax=Lamprotornis superbus TaxID=245042 RepID=A0A835TYP1_9PASS|nr:hypothetical protein IHE44_0001507 [Lamprotornis superbus]